MKFIVLLIVGCSAPTPLRSTDTVAEDAERTDHDGPPMGDAVCLSNEQFDAILDIECPPVEAASCPDVEVTCEDSPVTVACECPDVAVTCEPEIVVVEAPAAECPKPEACEPEIVEIEVPGPATECPDAVHPKFINVSNPIPLNPRGVQRVLEFRHCAGSKPLTMVEFQFVLGEYTEGAEGGAWRTRSPCEVLDCDTVSVAWNVEDGSGDTIVTPLATRTEASATLATPFEWESTVIPSERCAYFSIETETRTDAPIGRYTIATQYFTERIEGDEDVSLTAPLLRGSEIIIAENADDTPTCVEQPTVRVWGLVPESRQTDMTRKLVAEIHAGDCDLRLDRLQVGILSVEDYDGGGGEMWIHYNRAVTTLMDEYRASIGTEGVDYAIGLGSVPALDASLQTGEDLTYVIPAHETAVFTVITGMRDDTPPGRYLLSLEAIESRIASTGEAVQIDGMPIHGQQFEM